jgi:hypothetical protein
LALDAGSFESILDRVQRRLVSQMNLGPGIALNEALCENLFMLLVSVLNDVPIFVIGKPVPHLFVGSETVYHVGACCCMFFSAALLLELHFLLCF